MALKTLAATTTAAVKRIGLKSVLYVCTNARQLENGGRGYVAVSFANAELANIDRTIG